MPVPGEHSEEVFGELLGLSAEDVRATPSRGVIAGTIVHPAAISAASRRGRSTPPPV